MSIIQSLSLPLVVLALGLSQGLTAQSIGKIEVIDINRDPVGSGPGDSKPTGFFAWRGMLYFSADGGVSDGGREPWRSDGTPLGTQQLADIRPGKFGSDPDHFKAAGRFLYFTARLASGGRKLFRTTERPGTVQLVPGQSGIHEVLWTSYAVGPRLYFAAKESRFGKTELWVADGGGVTGKTDLPLGMVVLGSKLLFPHKGELGVSDGSLASTTIIDVLPGSWSSSPRSLMVIGDRCYFTAVAEIRQQTRIERWRHLWMYDGATQKLVDLTKRVTWNHYESVSSGVRAGDFDFFEMYTKSIGSRFWRTNGTEKGTESTFDKDPKNITSLGNRVTFTTLGLNNSTVWAAVGDKSPIIIHSCHSPGHFVKVRDGYSIYLAKDTANGAVKVFGTRGASHDTIAMGVMTAPTDVARAGGSVFFSGTDPNLGEELFAASIGATTAFGGPGCNSGSVRPTLEISNPHIGKKLEFRGTGAPTSSSNVTMMLLVVGVPGYHVHGGCPIYVDLAQPPFLFPVRLSSSNWLTAATTPNQAQLIGATLSAQGYFPAHALTTNGVLVYPNR